MVNVQVCTHFLVFRCVSHPFLVITSGSAAVQTAAELKEAGNKLHQAGKHDAAIRKYQRALDSLAGVPPSSL